MKYVIYYGASKMSFYKGAGVSENTLVWSNKVVLYMINCLNHIIEESAI